jgi:hypothetical protein
MYVCMHECMYVGEGRSGRCLPNSWAVWTTVHTVQWKDLPGGPVHGYYFPLLMYVLVVMTLVEDWYVQSGHPQSSAARILLEAIVQHSSAPVLMMLLSDDVHTAIPEPLALKLRRVTDWSTCLRRGWIYCCV